MIHVGRDVGLARGVKDEVDGVLGVGALVLQVEPLHFWVVGAVMVNDMNGSDRVGEETGAATLGCEEENVNPANDGQCFELRDWIAAEAGRDRNREEEAVAPATEAGCGGTLFCCVGGDEVGTAEIGDVGWGCCESWRVGG